MIRHALRTDETVRINSAIASTESLSPPDAAGWNAIVASFADASYDQTSAYGYAVWGKERVRHLIVRKKGEAVAAAQAILFRPAGLPRGLAYVKNGPLWISKGGKPEPGNYDLVLETLVNELVIASRLYLVVQPPAHPESSALATAALRRAGFRLRQQTEESNRYLVNLSLDQESQKRSLGGKWRYNLKQSARSDLKIQIARGPEALTRFAALHDGMLQRKSFEDNTWFASLGEVTKSLCDELAPRTVLVTHEGRDVAGAIVGGIGATAQYLFGASNAEGAALKAGYALQWWIVNWLSGMGYDWYDLGGESGNAGLRQFKKGLVGKRGHVEPLPGEFAYGQDVASRAIAEAAFGTRALISCFRGLRLGQRGKTGSAASD